MALASFFQRLPIILIAAFLLRVAWAWIIPPLEGPDEIAHAKHVIWIAEHWRLPVMAADAWTTHRYEDYQAPLYYWVCALVWKVCQFGHLNPSQSLLILRLFTGFVSLSLIVSTVRTINQVFPEQTALAYAAGWLVALTPMMAYNSTIINNDTFLCVFAGIALYTAVAVTMASATMNRGQALVLVLALTASIYSKASAVLLFPALSLCLAYHAFRFKSGKEVSKAALCIAVPLLLALPMWLRNYHYYNDPFGVSAVNHASAQAEQLPPKTFAEVQTRAIRTLKFIALSFWGSFGRANQINTPWSPESLYAAKLNFFFYTAALLLPILSFTAGKRQWDKSDTDTKATMVFLSVAALTYLVANVNYGIQHNTPHGRFLYPVITCYALILLYGFSRMVSAWLPLIVALSLSSANFYLWHRLIVPVYHQGPAFVDPTTEIQVCGEARFTLTPIHLTKQSPPNKL